MYWSSVLLQYYPQHSTHSELNICTHHFSLPISGLSLNTTTEITHYQGVVTWFMMLHTVSSIIPWEISTMMSIAIQVTLTASCAWREMLQHETHGLWGETSLCLSSLSLPPSISSGCFYLITSMKTLAMQSFMTDMPKNRLRLECWNRSGVVCTVHSPESHIIKWVIIVFLIYYNCLICTKSLSVTTAGPSTWSIYSLLRPWILCVQWDKMIILLRENYKLSKAKELQTLVVPAQEEMENTLSLFVFWDVQLILSPSSDLHFVKSTHCC